MRALIIYHSRTGNTEKAGKLIGSLMSSRGIDVDFLRINPLKEEGYFKSIIMAIFKKEVPILNIDFDFSHYDIIVLGCPSWAGCTTPAANSFLEDVKEIHGKKAAAFTTMGGVGGRKAVRSLCHRLTRKSGIPAPGIAIARRDMIYDSMLSVRLEKFLDKVIK